MAATTHAGDEDSSAGDIRLHQDPRRPGAVTAADIEVPGGVEVHGLGWVLAPLLLWIVTALGGWIVVGLVLEKYLAKREKRRIIERSAR